MTPTPETPTTSLEQLIQQRKETLKSLKQAGIPTYPADIKLTHSIEQILEQFQSVQGEESPADMIVTAGRLMTIRDMGKSTFAHIADGMSKIQIYFKKDVVGEETYKLFTKQMDIGDFVEATGQLFRTHKGELTLRVQSFRLLAKSLRPLPEKWHGLKDVEVRYRQRELDLASNPEIQKLFITRSKLIQSLRQSLYQQNFLEVETPLLQAQAGGAAARPFKTFHNALERELFLRIAPELYLKRLLVGGLPRVFEIGKVFRNEGIDTQHNPEFTLLEAYRAYADYNDMMTLCETLFQDAAQNCTGSTEFTYHEKPLSLKAPFARATLSELCEKYIGEDAVKAWRNNTLRALSEKHGVPAPANLPDHKVFDHLFDVKVKPHLWNPTFVTDYPIEISPLAKKHRSKEGLVERFELYVAGQELANAYSELNDPTDQRERLESQLAQKQKGDEEAELADETFVTALEHGMPPAGGLGIGIDRLAMLILSQTSIREVILFPLQRN